uniref:Uncharacterized protein n=1 Tax=Chryseobacterium endophyticum TaxID=1854762 RepID=A0AAU6WS23_9FLAO
MPWIKFRAETQIKYIYENSNSHCRHILQWICFCPGKKQDTVKTKTIEGVTMTKQIFKKQSDRFVYDVASSPVAKGNTTFDLLKQTPLLSTTDDKTFKIVGKNNVLIYINGRKSNMDAESLPSS